MTPWPSRGSDLAARLGSRRSSWKSHGTFWWCTAPPGVDDADIGSFFCFLALSRWLGKNDWGGRFPGFQRYPAWGSTRRAGAGWAGWASRGTMCNHEMSWVVEIETAIAISSQVRKALRNIDSENYELFVPKNLNFQSLHGMATSAPLALHLTRGAGEQQPIRADCLEVDSGSCAPSFGRCLHQSSNWSEMKIPSFSFSQRLPFSIFFVPALIYANDQMYVLCLFPVVLYKHSFDMLPCSRMYSQLCTWHADRFPKF